MTISNWGNIIEGAALLVSIGFNGLLIYLYKESEHEITEYQEENSEYSSMNIKKFSEIVELRDIICKQDQVIANLVINQKPIPWNKGKKGYKISSKGKSKKQLTPIEVSEAGGYTSESQL